MTSSPTSIVTLRDAVVLVGGFPLLSGVNLDLDEGTLSVVTGANGAGKTSLLRLIGGLVGLSSGTGVASGIDLASGDLRELRRRVGWLGHEGSFYDDLAPKRISSSPRRRSGDRSMRSPESWSALVSPVAIRR